MTVTTPTNIFHSQSIRAVQPGTQTKYPLLISLFHTLIRHALRIWSTLRIHRSRLPPCLLWVTVSGMPPSPKRMILEPKDVRLDRWRDSWPSCAAKMDWCIQMGQKSPSWTSRYDAHEQGGLYIFGADAAGDLFFICLSLLISAFRRFTAFHGSAESLECGVHPRVSNRKPTGGGGIVKTAVAGGTKPH